MDPEHRCAVARVAAELPELQDGASTLSAVVRAPGMRYVLTKVANALREQGETDESGS